MKTETIQLVIGALGLIKKGLQQRTEKKSLGQSPHHSLQKMTLLGIGHILWKVLS